MPVQVSALVCPLLPELETEAVPSWYSVCQINYTRDTWVKLLQLPNDFAYDQAKLMCRVSEETWAAWVPDHGEVLLDRSYFYC